MIKITPAYLSALEKCNPQQLAAIRQTEGPVLVLAGPGTGKTQILSLRIGHILSHTDMQPHNILCLTYTDAGTVAMRKRLISHLGAEAHKISIHTFHSFCNAVIQQNRDYFTEFGSLEPITELEQVELMYQLINSFTPDNPLKRYTGDVHFDRYRLKNLFDTIKKENLNPAELIAAAQTYIENLPYHEDFIYKVSRGEAKKGEPNLKKIKEETDKINQFTAAVKAFETYRTLMLNAQRYDFNDMINFVIKAFEQHESLLWQYQEQFQYILVDEFQDTNGAQNKILDLLLRFWDAPNVFVVGDDDQSIYSFQGAENARINEFVRKYSRGLQAIVLTQNYRSTQTILDAAKGLIEHNQKRLITDSFLNSVTHTPLHKNLTANQPENGALEIREYENNFQEAAHIAQQLQVKHQNNEDLSKTAIIYRYHSQVDTITKVLKHLNVPFQIRRQTNVLEHILIQKCITLLNYIRLENEEPEKGSHLLFEILHYDFWDIHPKDCTRLALAAQSDKTSIRSIMANNGRMFHLGLVSASEISRLEQNLTRWQKDAYNSTLQTLFEKIITYGGIVSYINKSAEKLHLLEVLTAFFDFIKNESVKNPHLTIGNLLETFQKMENNRIAIPITEIVGAANGVNLVTAHSSKGLEYNCVYVMGCTSDNWEGKRDPQNNFKFPPTIVSTSKDKNVEEERRLFYVAMTRAEQFLYLSYHTSTTDGKERTPSRFITEVAESTLLNPTTHQVSHEWLSQYALLSLLEPSAPAITETEKTYIDEVLKNYKLSVTHLNKYLECPLTFYYENILRIPTARSANMGFGSAIHAALEKLFKNLAANPQRTFEPVEKLLKYFSEAMTKYASHFTEHEFDLRLQYGKQTLTEYYHHYVNQWHKHALIEYDLHTVVTKEGIPLNGKLDKVEIYNNTATVVDYKTGKPDNANTKKKTSPPDADPTDDDFEKKWGGNYWRQIVFYKILLDNDPRFTYTMVAGEIDYVEKSKKEEPFVKQKIVPTPHDVETVHQQIKYAYDGIMNHQFYKGCGKTDCKWCNFVSKNLLDPPLAAADEAKA